MFRENVLTRPEIIEQIARNMVPVAVNYEHLRDDQRPEARFLRPLLEQRNQDQGVWVFAPDGKALGGFVGFGDMVGRTKAMLDSALEAFGPVAPRNPERADLQPYRGKGVMADGRICLALCVRRWGNNLHSHGITSPVISDLVLSTEELSALTPRVWTAGETWSVPAPVARRFCRLTSPLCYQHAPRPDWVTEARMTATVRSNDGQAARIAYEVRLTSVHAVGGSKLSEQTVVLAGEGMGSPRSGRLQSLLLVGSGTLTWSEAADQPVTFNALAEWRADPAAGIAPAPRREAAAAR